MRFLHTSDWHVGRTIRNRSRLDEHRELFSELLEIARREQVDAVLVTGDIFHERRPPPAAEELVAQILAELAASHIPSVVIPGNHDDPARLRTLKPLGDLLQVHIVSHLSEVPADLVITLPARNGAEGALVGCLPYLPPHHVLTAAEGAGKSEDARLSTYQSKVQEYFRAIEETMQRMDKQAVSVILAHAYIGASEYGGGEWRSSVLPIDAGILPGQVHYVALGHMHKPQTVSKAKAQARYAGSILQMDFGEREQEKSVFLIDAKPDKPAEVRAVPLTRGKPLLRKTGTAQAVLSEVEACSHAWIEVVLEPDPAAAELVDRIRAQPGVVSVRFAEGQAASGGSDGFGVALAERPAAELFAEYYHAKRKTSPEPQLVALFDRLYQEVRRAGDGEEG